MGKKIKAALLALMLAVTTGCGSSAADAEIMIPILDSSAADSYKTVAAEYYDLQNTMSVGGGVEYAFAETLSIGYDTNLISMDVKKNDRLAKGDVIAVFDSSALDYDRQNQKIVTDNAYARYAASGTEAARLEYEREAMRLELIDYKISEYTITAPYDCIIASVTRFETGQTVEAGTEVCSVADPEDVYITVERDKDSFAFGKLVGLKFGTSETYSGRVVEMPEAGIGRGINSKVLISFEEGELARAQADVGDIVSAGWVTVLVKTLDIGGALCIPKDAVMLYSGATYCYLDKNGERTRIPIETGVTVDDLTVVLSGLTAGDMISY